MTENVDKSAFRTHIIVLLYLRANPKNQRFARKDVLAHGLSSTAFGKIGRIDENRDFVRKLLCKYFHSLTLI